jgi:malonate-semialdehyde dehydrogenase (acetylating)/methylmalonate-semialdehyde dehydrogenase
MTITETESPDALEASPPVVCHFIGGGMRDGATGRFGDVFNPALGSRSRRVALACKGDVDGAIDAAAEAFPFWSAFPPLRRARILNKFGALLEENQDRLAALITSEHGKVLSDAKGEVQRGIEVVEFATGIPHLLKGEYTEQVGRGIDSYSVLQSLE